MRTHEGISKTGGGCREILGWQKIAVRQSPPPQTASGRLVQFGLGRVLLHVICLCRDRQVRWHLTGIRRELGNQ